MQIFVVILDSCGIKIVAKYKQDIRIIKNIEYPFDKSDMYVQGTIEQEVNDCLISLKAYIKRVNLKVCMI